MKSLTIFGPINKLSYGRVTSNLVRELSRITEVALIPIGQCEVDSEGEKDLIEKCANTKPDFNAPIIKIWHQHDMRMPQEFIGPKYGLPIFELDTFTNQELEQLSSVKILNCTKWAERVCRNYNLNTSGIVNLAVDRSIFNTRPMPEGKFTVVNIGKAEIRKGHDIIPQIFYSAFSKKDDVRLIMAFDNPFYSNEEMKSWKRFYQNELDGYDVQFASRFESQDGVANLIENCHCGLYPARAEGWNLDALETLSMGRYVISTNYSGHSEFLTKENSYITTPDDTEPAIDGKWFFGQGNWAKLNHKNFEEMARQLKYLYWLHKTPYMGLELNEAGIETAKKFSWQNSAKQLMGILNGND